MSDTPPAESQGSKTTAVAILVREEMLSDSDCLMQINILKRQLEETGVTVFFESEKEYMARGRVADCDCQLIQCVCAEARKHKIGCQRRLAMTCPVPISCDAHGLEVCQECDPCSCEEIKAP